MSEEIKKTSIKAEPVASKSHENTKNHTHKAVSEHSNSGKHHDHKHVDHETGEHKHDEHKTETDNTNSDYKQNFFSTLDKLTVILDTFFNKQLPTLPVNVKEVLVQIVPYLTIAGIVFSGLGLLFVLLALPFFLVAWFFVVSALSIFAIILSGLSVPYLFKRQKKGWTYSYYAFLIGLVGNLLSNNFAGFALSALITLIGGYLLFQIRSYYK